jgi:hypothetical protein
MAMFEIAEGITGTSLAVDAGIGVTWDYYETPQRADGDDAMRFDSLPVAARSPVSPER